MTLLDVSMSAGSLEFLLMDLGFLSAWLMDSRSCVMYLFIAILAQLGMQCNYAVQGKDKKTLHLYVLLDSFDQ